MKEAVRNIDNIKYFITMWKQLTYEQGVKKCYSLKEDTEVYKMVIEVLRIQCLENKIMDGNSIKNLPVKNEGKIDVIFSDIFWELVEGFLSPANYIVTIVKKCMNNGSSDAYEIAGVVGRGLRAFPSFLREVDLSYKFTKVFPDADVINGPMQDVQEHTDILIKDDDYNYRIWSYQNFERGLTNTASRLSGKRGNIPEGIHVLCPIDIGNKFESEEIEGWYFYSERYVKYLYEMIIIERPDEYSFVSRMDEYMLKMYLKKANTIKK